MEIQKGFFCSLAVLGADNSVKAKPA